MKRTPKSIYCRHFYQLIILDLKLDNILVNFEDQSVLDEFAEAQSENPMLQKRRDGHSIYQSHNQFGPLRVKFGPIHPIITDFSHAQWIDNSQPQINPIQHDCYRAPEVILGIGWSYSADIWNLGLLVRSVTTLSLLIDVLLIVCDP